MSHWTSKRYSLNLSPKMPETRCWSGKRECSQELLCHKRRTNPVSLRRGMEKMAKTGASGLKERWKQTTSWIAHLLHHLQWQHSLKHLPHSLTQMASYIYLLKDRFVIVDIINFHNNLGSTCKRMGPSRGIIISSCDVKYIVCPLQLRKRTWTKSN